ncbi:pilus assembly protein [Ottowia sp.]|uniref:pilus assembly protein n=1 Tax=Ottowia sp. TaxID=1898956 RepID=UPI0039E594F0
MSRITLGQRRFRKTLLALAAGSALAPHASWALTLTTAPPGTITPYVAPNVILSLDDSGSMNVQATSQKLSAGTYCTAAGLVTLTKTTTITTSSSMMCAADGTYLGHRYEVLKNAVTAVFNDTTLLPDGKIRLAWQTMNDNTKVNGVQWVTQLGTTAAAAATATTTANRNLMRPLAGDHRANFLTFMNNFTANSSTPTHLMVQRADAYMRASLNANGPWATVPGASSPEYLGCRRNYHILLTDGGWNTSYQSTSPINYDGTTRTLPDGTEYNITSSQTQIYRDTDTLGVTSGRTTTYYSTIADWAFYSWSTALQTSGLTGSPDPSNEYRDAPTSETFTNRLTGATATLNKFWNPRYDPATWPHMVTFTIGFSSDAVPKYNYNASGTYVGAITSPTSTLPYGYDGNFADYANGTYRWKATTDRGQDMWHAAINGRGQFYSVEYGDDLKKAFQAIIGTINVETKPDTTSTAASGSNASRYDVAKFTGNYLPSEAWKGFVTSEIVQSDGTTAPNPAWNSNNTADRLDELSDAQAINDRLILSWSDQWNGVTGQPYKGGVSFKWASDETYLTTVQKATLGLSASTPVSTSGESILNYIRGNRAEEGSTTAAPFRVRTSRQGDIVNSSVWYTGAPSSGYTRKGYTAFVRSNQSREPMIYVGGNDGMLHGFSATDGSEKIAYVPRGVIASLKNLASTGYSHQYFVDGSPMTGDVDMSTAAQDSDDEDYDDSTATPDWRTLLVGTLGRGGKGYFVLDVTNPDSSPNADGVPGLAEANAQTLIKLDRTRGSSETAPDCTTMSGAEQTACVLAVDEDKDIGHITAQPVLDETNGLRTTQITRLNNNRWAVVLGNGYNSDNRRPVLLIQYLDGDKELKRIPVTTLVADPLTHVGTGLANDNGLSAPRLVDLNGDDRPDVAYAGDNQGNMWKFDLTDYDASNWNVAFSGSPLFTATGPSTLGASTRPNAQPITVAPTVRANDRTKTVTVSGVTTTTPVGGVMVAFGTGRNVTTDDPVDVKVQTLYSVLDNTRYKVKTVTGKGKRLQVHAGDTTAGIPAPAALGTGVTAAKLAKHTFSSSGLIVEDDVLDVSTWGDYNGWYVDLPATGERLLKNMEMYDNTNLLAVYSQVPAKGSDETDATTESCSSTTPKDEVQYRTLINIMDGAKPSVQLVDANGDGLFNAADGGVSRVQVTKGAHNMIASSKDRMLDVDAKNGKELLARMPEKSLRPSWRQLK